jgi:hypothetical protein
MGIRLFPAVHGHIADSVRDHEAGARLAAVGLPRVSDRLGGSPNAYWGCVEAAAALLRWAIPTLRRS